MISMTRIGCWAWLAAAASMGASAPLQASTLCVGTCESPPSYAGTVTPPPSASVPLGPPHSVLEIVPRPTGDSWLYGLSIGGPGVVAFTVPHFLDGSSDPSGASPGWTHEVITDSVHAGRLLSHWRRTVATSAPQPLSIAFESPHRPTLVEATLQTDDGLMANISVFMPLTQQARDAGYAAVALPAVPEPAPVGLLCAGLGALAWQVRASRRRLAQQD